MALVCDIKSFSNDESAEQKVEEVDLEDGEIEDDEEEVPTPVPEPPKPETLIPKIIMDKGCDKERPERTDRPKDRDRSDRRRHEEKGKKHMTEAEKSILHLRKREEMQRKKWEKFNRNKEPIDSLADDDFAKNIEKTLATILSKKDKEAAGILSGGESTDKDKDKDKDDDRRGKKRRKNERDSKRKQRRLESPDGNGMDEEIANLNNFDDSARVTPQHSEDSGESEYASDRSKGEDRLRRRNLGGRRGGRNREHGGRKKNKDRKNDMGPGSMKQQQPLIDSHGVCVFYLQGKCTKNDCPYSHEAVPPMKLELCKFYLMDCCAKGEKCSYMHSEFPCKFYHTGLSCSMGDNCKFAHGKPLSEGLKQILFKHIETAPRDILGGFPRMSREEALDMIDVAQNKLREQHGNSFGESGKEETKGGIPSLFDINVPIPPELMQGLDEKMNKSDKPGRNRPSRWQDLNSHPGKDINFPAKPFSYGQDQDMRINSNGDVDMRTLPPPIIHPPNIPQKASIDSSTADIDLERYKREAAGFLGSSAKQDVDIRNQNELAYTSSMDVDIRRNVPISTNWSNDIRRSKDPELKIANEEIANPELKTDLESTETRREVPTLPADLPKTQRDLFMRIHAQQREESTEKFGNKTGYEVEDNINWYSDDDDEDDDRLTIKVDCDDIKEKEEVTTPSNVGLDLLSPPRVTQDDMKKLGDLSKIDISAEVTKLLTSINQNRNQFPPPAKEFGNDIQPEAVPTSMPNDPRITRSDPRTDSSRTDPRLAPPEPKPRSRQSSTEVTAKPEKLSIYEQGSIDRNQDIDDLDIDIRGTRSDVDLRNLQLPFVKGGSHLRNYTPATEIDARIASHPPISWRVAHVDVPRPDYTGLKLNAAEAEKTGDPRLKKIFKLDSSSSNSTEERDTPLSPKASPKGAGTAPRVDPRLRKMEEGKSSETLNFNQQLNMLQSSAFYLSLTSNQKLLLNQEISQRNDSSSNQHDPVLNSLLSNLNLIPGTNVQSNPNAGAALSILTNVTKMNNPLMGAGQPGNPNLMGQNPNLMNQMAQSIVQPGLLGAAPGVPNLPPDFPMNFDPRNGGLLGNAPIPSFGGFPGQDGQSSGNFNNFNDDFYPPAEGGGPAHNFSPRDNHRGGFNRDRRRGRSFNNRNNGGNRNFRNNRNNNRPNRNHSPP